MGGTRFYGVFERLLASLASCRRHVLLDCFGVPVSVSLFCPLFCPLFCSFVTASSCAQGTSTSWVGKYVVGISGMPEHVTGSGVYRSVFRLYFLTSQYNPPYLSPYTLVYSSTFVHILVSDYMTLEDPLFSCYIGDLCRDSF